MSDCVGNVDVNAIESEIGDNVGVSANISPDSKVSVNWRFTVCQSTSGFLFFYLMMSDTLCRTQIGTTRLPG